MSDWRWKDSATTSQSGKASLGGLVKYFLHKDRMPDERPVTDLLGKSLLPYAPGARFGGA